MLAFVDAVLAAHAHVLVTRAVLFEISQLEIQGLLHAENRRALVQDHGAGSVFAVLPHVVAVLGRPVADVERHHGKGVHFLGLAGKGQQRQQGRQEEEAKFTHRYTF